VLFFLAVLRRPREWLLAPPYVTSFAINCFFEPTFFPLTNYESSVFELPRPGIPFFSRMARRRLRLTPPLAFSLPSLAPLVCPKKNPSFRKLCMSQLGTQISRSSFGLCPRMRKKLPYLSSFVPLNSSLLLFPSFFFSLNPLLITPHLLRSLIPGCHKSPVLFFCAAVPCLPEEARSYRLSQYLLLRETPPP